MLGRNMVKVPRQTNKINPEKKKKKKALAEEMETTELGNIDCYKTRETEFSRSPNR